MSRPVKPSPAPRRRPTQADVAALAGVSTATVSHILSGRSDRKGTGNAETRQRVERAMAQLGYRPNWAGRALRRQRTGLVGALVSSPWNPWRESLIAIAHEELARHELDLVVLPDAGIERTLSLLDRRVMDGCFTVHVEDPVGVRRLVDSPVPVIAFTENVVDGLATVRHDYAPAAIGATRTLLARGIRRFVLVTEEGGGPDQPDPAFADPVQEVIAEAGLELAQCVVPRRISPELDSLPWEELAGARVEDPIVLLCGSDRSAIQIAAECTRRGLALGRTVGVVGRGDLSEGTETAVPISTLGTAVADYAGVFAHLAEASVAGERITRDWTFSWDFIERDATASLRRG
ncbi:LacI family DNA-binding transcriptional regulator [Brachybacterium sp. YJGR34]|uniref:LacI family DNA-binding transcriptional regulator n=1 Tax=Brachybacterium sp. YJGR34 TaxID=2059911 RepID=UPI0018E5EBD6|nr:LacI family DNA-binding transcriptional regulator [Brachybacterium sp. YJGR34]